MVSVLDTLLSAKDSSVSSGPGLTQITTYLFSTSYTKVEHVKKPGLHIVLYLQLMRDAHRIFLVGPENP